MSKRVTTYRERRQMEDLIMANSTPIDGNEIDRVWKAGFDPKVIAEQIGNGITAEHVRTFTARTLGLTIRSPVKVERANEKADLLDRIAALETRLETLEQWCYSNEVPSNVTKLKGA